MVQKQALEELGNFVPGLPKEYRETHICSIYRCVRYALFISNILDKVDIQNNSKLVQIHQAVVDQTLTLSQSKSENYQANF